jgi:hypothetical protein
MQGKKAKTTSLAQRMIEVMDIRGLGEKTQRKSAHPERQGYRSLLRPVQHERPAQHTLPEPTLQRRRITVCCIMSPCRSCDVHVVNEAGWGQRWDRQG